MELTTNEDFKNQICLPYFKDIYKDLQSRSDDPQMGINKVSLLDYAQLPGVLGERLFQVLDKNQNGYLDQNEFVSGLFRVYCSSFDQKVQLIFEIYDFDNDGFITQNDIHTIMSSMPVINLREGNIQEGKFTQEGGGLESFEERVQSLDEMSKILSECFGGMTKLNPLEFKKMNEEKSSDSVLSVMNLFRERLPCSENFWRYKRNYDILIRFKDQNERAKKPVTRRIASPKMRHVRALSPYASA